jgi:hypothetical protein
VPPGYGPASLGISVKEFKDYGPGTGSISSVTAATAGMSFKEATQYGPGTASVAPEVANAAPATPSIASTLDVHGVAAPSAGLTGTVSVNGVAHSNFGSISIETVGIGTPVGVAPTSNFATPSLADALGLAAQEAAAAAAARHEAFVARTEMEADMLNNQQLAEIGIKNAMVDRWAAAAGYYSSPDVAEVGAFDEKAFAAAMTQTMAQTMVNATISAVGMFTPGIGPAAAFAGLMSPHEAAPDAPAPTAPTTQYGMIEAAFTSVDANGFTSLDNGALRDFMNQTAPTPGQAFGTTGMTVIEAMQVARENQNGKGSPSSGSSSGTGTGTAEGEAETSSGPAGPGGNPYADREAAAQGKSSTSSGTSSTSGNDKGSSGGSDGGDGEGGDGGSESGSGNEGGSGSYAPVVLDLDGDGVELVDASAGAQYDTNDDGTRERLGWAGKDDGLLAIDLDGDGKITGAKELSFAMHTAEQGDTDLQGLAKVFDSNKDGVLDSNDKAFDKFRIWQDKDGDGISDKGEVKTLSEMGIKSIGVVSDGKAYMDAGNTVHGTASYTKLDGTTRSVGDVDFKIAPTNETNKGNKPTAPNNVGDDEDGDDEDAGFAQAARQALTGKIPTRLPEMSASGSAIAMAAAMGIAAIEATNALAAAKAGDLGTGAAADNAVMTATGDAVNAAIPVAVMSGSSAGDGLTVGATTGASRLNVGDVIAATMGQESTQSLRYLDHDPRPMEDVVYERTMIAMGYGPDRFNYDEPALNDPITQAAAASCLGLRRSATPPLRRPLAESAGDVVGLEDSWIKLAIKAGLDRHRRVGDVVADTDQRRSCWRRVVGG